MSRRNRNQGTICGALALALGASAAVGADLLRLDDGVTTRFRIHDTGATQFASTGGGMAALTVQQSGAGKVLVLRDGPSEVLTVANGGKVGINDPAPSQALDVVGNLAITGTVDGVDVSAHAANGSAHHTRPTSLPPSGVAGGDLSGSYPGPQVKNDSHTHSDGTVSNSISLSNGRLYAPTGSGYVGIGTTAPAARLQVGNGTAAAGIVIDDNATGGISPTITQAAAGAVFGGAASNADAWHSHASSGGGSTFQYRRAFHTVNDSGQLQDVVNVTGPGVLYSLIVGSLYNGVMAHVVVTIDGYQLINFSGLVGAGAGNRLLFDHLGRYRVMGTNPNAEPNIPMHIQFKSSLRIQHRKTSAPGSAYTQTEVRYGN